jgi:hypothetical protein
MAEGSTEAPSNAPADAGSSYWPDERVDAVCAAVVFTCLTLGAMWWIVNG